MSEIIRLASLLDYNPAIYQDKLIEFRQPSDEADRARCYKLAMIHNLNVIERQEHPDTHRIFIDLDRFRLLDCDGGSEAYVDVYVGDLILARTNVLEYHPALHNHEDADGSNHFNYSGDRDEQSFRPVPINVYIPISTPNAHFILAYKKNGVTRMEDLSII